MQYTVSENGHYKVVYDTERQRFYARNEDGDEIAAKPTQQECEDVIRADVKEGFDRIPVYRVSAGYVTSGEITSVNTVDRSGWWVMQEKPKAWGSGREKFTIRDSLEFYRQTEQNKELVAKVGELRLRITGLESDIQALLKSFDGRLTPADLGIKKVT
jgi:hypothetical protein